MKKTIYTLLGLLLAAGLTSCQDWFIEKPEVTGMDQDEVFSTAKNAEGAIAEAYATILSSGLPVLVWNNSPIMPYETTEAIMGGEDLCRLTWGYMDKQVVAGMLANNENNGAGYTDDYFPNNYAYIRKAWLVYENIDKVAAMSDRDKAIVKAEVQVLVAFRRAVRRGRRDTRRCALAGRLAGAREQGCGAGRQGRGADVCRPSPLQCRRPLHADGRPREQ